MPSLNQGCYIEAAIRSVLLQDYPNWELIVMDGGSTDQTLGVLEKYNSFIKFWRSEHDSGQSAAINQGFRMSKGTVIAWLNSDDLYEPDAFSRAVKAFNKSNSTIVFGKSRFIMEDENIFSGEYPVKPYVPKQLFAENYIAQPSVFLRKKENSPDFTVDETLKYCMDYHLWLRLSDQGIGFQYVPERLSRFRIHSQAKGSLSIYSFHMEILFIIFPEYFKVDKFRKYKSYMKKALTSFTQTAYAGRHYSKVRIYFRYTVLSLRCIPEFEQIVLTMKSLLKEFLKNIGKFLGLFTFR